MAENLLEVKGLKKYFPIKKGVFSQTVGHVKAVDDVSFTIKQGETLKFEPGGKHVMAFDLSPELKATRQFSSSSGRYRARGDAVQGRPLDLRRNRADGGEVQPLPFDLISYRRCAPRGPSLVGCRAGSVVRRPMAGPGTAHEV